MPLLTDSQIITEADLLGIDGELVAIARAHNITNIDGDGGFAQRACARIVEELMAAMQVLSPVAGDFSQTHMIAVMNTGLQGSMGARSRLHPSQILTHSDLRPYVYGPIKMWAVYRALQQFFEEISIRRKEGEDRYSHRVTQYRADALAHWNRLASGGVPYVLNPFFAPAAQVPGSGSFLPTNITTQAGTATGGTFRVAVCWTSSAYDPTNTTNRGDGESSPGPVLTVHVPQGKVLSVSIASLVPPTVQTVMMSKTGLPVQTIAASGWQLLVGQASGPLHVQNTVPIELGTTTYTLSGDPSFTTIEARPGQQAYSRMRVFNQALRI